MFTGIIETLGIISSVRRESGNIELTVTASVAAELRIDQSVSHNGVCLTVVKCNSHEYTVTAIKETIEKGSITVNGVSLTVVNSGAGRFSVAIIPYTYEHTNFSDFKTGTKVNLEFDVIGKYVARLYSSGRE